MSTPPAPSIDANSADADGWTPLHIASHKGRTAVVSTLLAHPTVNLNSRSTQDFGRIQAGVTPLWLARDGGHSDVVALLEARGGVLAQSDASPLAAARALTLSAAHALPPGGTSLFARQLVLPAFGAPSQAALSRLRVLLVGAGGTGCPAALYLAGAGAGELTIVDGDAVEASNLHRQVAHARAGVGLNKAASLAAACDRLTGGGGGGDGGGAGGDGRGGDGGSGDGGRRGDAALATAVRAVPAALGVDNVDALLARAHVAVDCSDSLAVRYLLSDACVRAGVPLVAASALGLDAQVAVYAWAGVRRGRGGGGGVGGGGEGGDGDDSGGEPAARAPCYRCVHPDAPPAAACPPCADAGVLGPVAGVAGALAALEVLKLAAAAARADAESAAADDAAAGAPPQRRFSPSMPPPAAGRLLAFDVGEGRCRPLRLREPRADCAACGRAATLRSAADTLAWWRRAAGDGGGIDAAGSAGAGAGGGGDDARERRARDAAAAAETLAAAGADALRAAAADGALILDVRSRAQYAAAHVRPSGSLPLAELDAAVAAAAGESDATPATVAAAVRAAVGAACGTPTPPRGARVLTLCRRGVDSETAASILRERGELDAVSVAGGLRAVGAKLGVEWL